MDYAVVSIQKWEKLIALNNIVYQFFFSFFNIFTPRGSKCQKPHKVYNCLACLKFGVHASMSVCLCVHPSVR